MVMVAGEAVAQATMVARVATGMRTEGGEGVVQASRTQIMHPVAPLQWDLEAPREIAAMLTAPRRVMETPAPLGLLALWFLFNMHMAIPIFKLLDI